MLFQGTLNSRNAEQGNTASFHIALSAGDRITATALCEAAADGNRLIDPALTISAPQAEDSLQPLQWYNDDSDNVVDCVNYRSAQLTFEAPVTGEYEFVIENLAGRDGPYSLEILGSTAIQTQLDGAPPALDDGALVESGADEPGATVALAAAQGEALTFSGVLTGSDAAPNNARTYEIQLNSGDAVSARLVCDEYQDSRPFHPQLEVDFTDNNDASRQWVASAETAGVTCDDQQTSVAVSFAAPETGSYAFTVSNRNQEHGAYTLSVGGVTADQPPQTPALWDGSDPNVEGRWASAEFSGGEGSLIVVLQAGTRIAALAACLEDEDGERPANPQLHVLDPNGDVVATADESQDYQICDGGYSAYIEFTAEETGNYTFVVSASGSGDTTSQAAAQAVQPENNPASIHILFQIPEQANNDDDGGGDTGNTGGKDCSGNELIGKLSTLACIFRINTDDGHQRFDLYRIDDKSVGHFVFSVNTSQLGNAPSSDTQVASGGIFRAYHRPNGDLRFTGGPDGEGKTFEFVVAGATSGRQPSTPSNNADTSSDTSTSTPTYQAVHTVQSGETLYSIAGRYGVSVQAIADANGIGSDYIIHVGNRLNIPNR